MSWFGFNALGNAWYFLLLIPLIIFYFLKLKRPRIDFPSLVLWRQVLQDKRVNSPFQKFKKNLLLLLQILLLILAVIALLQPYFIGKNSQAKRLPILIDNSVSMSAYDISGGITRLEDAKKKVQELIDNLMPGQEIALLSFANSGKLVIGFTDNKRLLRKALNSIQTEDTASNLEDVLRMTQAMSRNYNFNEISLFSDGNFPERVHFDLPFNVNFQTLKAAGANVGITSLAARRSNGSMWSIFVNLSSSESAESATVEFYQNGKKIGSEIYAPSANPQKIVFQVDGIKASDIEVKIKADDFDSMAADNKAFIRLPKIRKLRVYVSENMMTYKKVLNAINDLEIYPNQGLLLEDAPYDLAITDKEEHLNAQTLLKVGFIPASLSNILEEKSKSTEIIDWKKNSRLLQHVNLSDIITLNHIQFINQKSEKDLENKDYRILVHTTTGPFLLEKRINNKLIYQMLIHSDKTTLPYKLAFPIMTSNLVQIAMKKAGLLNLSGDATGILPPLQFQENSECTITSPDNIKITEKTNNKGMLKSIPALKTGVYSITSDKQTKTLGISLFSLEETVMKSVAAIRFNELSVDATTQKTETDQSLWKFFTFLVFLLILFEWWFFQKKPGGFQS